MSGFATPDTQRIALSIQQPWAELILQGIKSVEIRKTPTKIRGQIYLYASQQFSSLACARDALTVYNLQASHLPRGCLVGTVELLDCRESQPADARLACVPESLLSETFSWSLGAVERSPEFWPVKYLPYGPWFYPFRRSGASASSRDQY